MEGTVLQDLIFDLLTFLKDLGLFQKFPARNSTASFQQKKTPNKQIIGSVYWLRLFVI